MRINQDSRAERVSAHTFRRSPATFSGFPDPWAKEEQMFGRGQVSLFLQKNPPDQQVQLHTISVRLYLFCFKAVYKTP